MYRLLIAEDDMGIAEAIKTPISFAGLHLGFAFPFVSKILLMFAFSNTTLSILVNIACFAAFGILYALVYKITSGAYYAIVSGGKKV